MLLVLLLLLLLLRLLPPRLLLLLLLLPRLLLLLLLLLLPQLLLLLLLLACCCHDSAAHAKRQRATAALGRRFHQLRWMNHPPRHLGRQSRSRMHIRTPTSASVLIFSCIRSLVSLMPPFPRGISMRDFRAAKSQDGTRLLLESY